MLTTNETLPIDALPVLADVDVALPDHLAPLPGGRPWAQWRWIGLRGSGFPSAQVLTLAAPQSAALIDQLLQAADEAQQAREQARAAIDQALATLRRNQEWENQEKREPLIKALRLIKKGKLPQPDSLGAGEQALVEAVRAADAAVAAARARYEQSFERDSAQVDQAIRAFLEHGRFREAFIWQNRHAFHRVRSTFQRHAPGAGGRHALHRDEMLIASYVQRYCAKNDMIGFFGPVGWAKVNPYGEALAVRPGPELLATRKVYFEQWCIDTLAETLGRNQAIRPWLAPRRLPYAYLEGTALFLPPKKQIGLPRAQALVLEYCTGERTAKEIAMALVQSHPGEFKSVAQVYAILEGMQSMGLIAWTLEVPFQLYPEQALRERLERIEDERLRGANLRALGAVEAARQAIANAAGDADRLDQALGVLETIFTRLTGGAATRSDGAMYAGRTLLYEDCRRDVEVEIGPALLEALGPPLTLLLESARWLTFEAAVQYRELFRAIYSQLMRELGSPTVDALSFWRQVQRALSEHGAGIIEGLVSEFQRRWADILHIPAGQRRADYASDALWPRVSRAFAAPRPGWLLARHHSPDILIAAAGVEALRQGHYQLVMGELHVATNTLTGSSFVSQHPAPEELFMAVASDLAAQRVAPLVPRTWPETTSRTRPVLASPAALRLVFSNDAADPATQLLPIGELVIEDSPAGLIARTHDRRLQVDIVECFADLLSREVIDCFKLFPSGGHTPRLTIDRLVVCRETWRFSPAEIAFADEKSDAERFLAARRWARAHDLPRFVFVTSPVERKPIYIDFDSPILLDVFARLVRRTAERGGEGATVGVSEMLPSLDQIWLLDGEGQRYTSEFRIVAVDRIS